MYFKKIILFILVCNISFFPIIAKESRNILVPVISYYDVRKTTEFYGNKLSVNNIFGGYGGLDILLNNPISNISAFIEIGGGVQLHKKHLYNDDSYSFINFGYRYYF